MVSLFRTIGCETRSAQPAFEPAIKLAITLAIATEVILSSLIYAAEPPHFSRDVLPILSENCFACHGPDSSKRESDLRLDEREHLLKAISLEQPAESELLARVRTVDAEELMPPPASHKQPLNARQIDILQGWIENGAEWGKHWSFEPPVKVSLLPNSKSHPIDALVSKRLEDEGLTLAPAAPWHTLQRRLSFDLIGLPPQPGLAPLEPTSEAIGKYVDELLSSPHYGERMAMWWLDVARYSDTDGFQADATRTNWPWRDWVVDAFNQNMRFDQFTIEQFAGDLLPDATDEQKLATCFHRNHMTNGEGGRDPEESRVDYVIDRVNTLGTVWLGLTLGCCQCHSHKFDPVSQADYYSLSAFFNSIDEDGKAGSGAKPYLSYQSGKTSAAIEEATQLVESRKPAEVAARTAAEVPFQSWLQTQLEHVQQGFIAWHPLAAIDLEASEGTALTQVEEHVIQASGKQPLQDDYRVIAAPKLPRITGFRLEVFPHATHTNGGLTRGGTGEFILTDVKLQVRRRGSSQIRDVVIKSAVADFSADKKANNNYGDIKDTLDDDPRNGWSTKGAPNTQPHTALFALQEPLRLDDDEELVIELRHRSTLGDANLGRFRLSVSEQLGEAIRSLEPSPLEALAATTERESERLDEKLRSRLFRQFLEDYEPYQIAHQSLARAEKQLEEVNSAAKQLKVMVLEDREKPRETFVLVRGVWDKPGDKVTADVPAAIADWPEGEVRTRLGLAKWLISPKNPLTARVFVNHVWQMLFGQGLVRTPDDFGLQGEAPVHAELLDWLAVDFMESGWDVKQLLRTIVTSKTYQQCSDVNSELLARDPDNRWLARGARFRLPSWMLRDAALQVSGLLNPLIGGPPVRPYQPAGVWEELFMGRFTYEPSEGEAQYRRTLYAFWRRSIAPTFLFDAAQRRSCEVRLGRTNTPLHALTLLNDVTYLEASRDLAAIAIATHADRTEQLQCLFRNVLTREPTAKELAVLEREAARAAEYYDQHPNEALQVLDVGQRNVDTQLNQTDVAGLMIVASMLLNLDEAMTHE